VTRTPFLAAAFVFASAATASAQAGLYSKAKSVTQRAVAATNAHVEAEQHPEAKAPAAKSAPAQSAAVQQGAPKSANGKSAAGEAQSGQPVTKLNIASADTIPPAMIMRESYDYSRDGRRDPFVSLLTTNELRPTMSDLRLTGILYDISGHHSVATLRDLSTNELYRVAAGSPLGRMRVSEIRLKSVVFTIDEFGTTRQDSLVLGDSTKARGK
jgi:hypothetical protein